MDVRGELPLSSLRLHCVRVLCSDFLTVPYPQTFRLFLFLSGTDSDAGNSFAFFYFARLKERNPRNRTAVPPK